jgi:hypothetical protein
MKKTILSIAAALFFLGAVAGTGGPKGNGDKYCAKMKDGKMQVMHDGNTITSDVTLSNGTKIMMDGTVMKSDGTKMKLKEGECVDKNGMSSMDDKKGMNKDKDMNNKDNKDMDKKKGSTK